MMTYRLHGSPISPYARKVMILARVHDIVLDIIPAKASGSSGYTGGDNPLGKIPALEWWPGQWLFDSPVICEWLDAQGADPLLPNALHPRTIQKWQHALGDGISDATYNLRYETVRPKALFWPEMIERHETALRTSVATLESIVSMLGENWTYGNLAIVCGLDYLSYRGAHLDWPSLAPALSDWHKAMSELPHWERRRMRILKWALFAIVAFAVIGLAAIRFCADGDL